MSTSMTFGVETSTHRPKYRLWLGLYIITLYNTTTFDEYGIYFTSKNLIWNASGKINFFSPNANLT